MAHITQDQIDIQILREVLTGHWLFQIECNHQDKTDAAICSCSRAALPKVNSVGEAASTWVEHVINEYREARRAKAIASSSAWAGIDEST